jgi:hypothetical protein
MTAETKKATKAKATKPKTDKPKTKKTAAPRKPRQPKVVFVVPVETI